MTEPLGPRDAIDEEIAQYSIKENIAYIALMVSAMIRTGQIQDTPGPVLVAAVIEIAEAFETEYGEYDGPEETILLMEQFATKELTARFGEH